MVDCFEMMTGESEQVLNRAVDRQESLDLSRRFESTHLPFLLPGVLMGHFNAVVFVLPGSMADGWENVPVRGRKGSQLISNKLQRWPLLVLQNLAKEALGSSLVSVTGDQDVEDIAVLIHRSPEITLLAADRNEQLIHVPDVTETTLSPAQGSRGLRSELPAPGPNGFVGHRDAALGEKVLSVAKAQREPMVQPDGVADHFGREAVSSIR